MHDGAVSKVATFIGIGSILLYLSLAYRYRLPGLASALQHPLIRGSTKMASVDLSWHPPAASWITDLTEVVNGTGVHGFIFNSSSLPANVPYATYNWCNMPHVRREEYVVPSVDYQLEYVELIHRHHKRTPYASNTFPQESYPWYCSDEGLFYYGQPLNPASESAASTFWQVYTTNSNPLTPAGFNGTCQFPQITREGLQDSYQHGKDLFGVYHDLLKFIPSEKDDTVSYRVTNNVITSQVAGMVISAMYPSPQPFPVQIQPDSIDSLEPAYTCTAATALMGNYASGSNNTNWTLHLSATEGLFSELDAISGVSPDNGGFHMSWDHYYDNLSARQCHSKPLPCNISNHNLCVTQQQADAVYRLGQYEYSYIYRLAPQSLPYAVASFGIWAAELVQNIRDAISASSSMKYRHNVAHDGSVSRLLSILQIDDMVWPGMGSEVVFEIWKKANDGKRYLRVLWGGEVLRSSNPTLGIMDMIDLDIFFSYIDGLVGRGASKVPNLCEVS
ncbi:uncharacterized protein PV09_07121 [Verruconis gallopava]|uniref:Acid phosphatase n=1 Tax=Verruconis gallopava TaxID=253628 RepID=A0A0D2AQC2_9PEZI|nr:uncharacterized protein PV09_07121 [Verruconis gallopava]KIW01349.1 hypothetical protein PV09_07121 [Verruconis gallopava]